MYGYLNSMRVYWHTFAWSVYDIMSIHWNTWGNWGRPKGIYIIWYSDLFGNPVTVYVGQGYIKSRLLEHRLDSAIRKYNTKGLMVSWTPIEFLYLRNRIERYLGDTLKPLVGTNYPLAMRRQVNLPWD